MISLQGPVVPVLIIAAALLLTGLVLYLHNRLYYKDKDSGDDTEVPARPDGCCGLHEVCEKAADDVLGEHLYYDDEELDAFRGRQPEDYTEAETEIFRDIMLTLRHDELLSWTAALEARGISLPAPLRDELVILLDG